MKQFKTYVSILYAAIWIGFFEFLRNQVLFKSYWVDHYKNLGLTFPEKPVNGVMWMLWSALFAVLIYKLAQKFSFKESLWLAWVAGFAMMWVVIGNLSVLPTRLLVFALPLSIAEVYIALVVIDKK